MLQDSSSRIKMEKDIERSLENLKLFKKELDQSLPAFFFSADLLLKYGTEFGSQNVSQQYFQQFNKQIQILTKIDEKKIKKHQKDIIEEILSIVDSQIFIECLRPDIRSSRTFDDRSQIYDSEEQIKIESSSKLKNYFQKNDTTSEIPLRESNKENIDALWQKLLVAYKEHRIDEANEIKNIFIENKFQTTKQQKQLFDTIALEYKTMIQFYSQFDQEGWIKDKEEDGVSLQYIVYDEQKLLAIRIESQFDISIENFLSILCEMDLFGDYVPFCYDTKQLKVVSRNEKIGTSKIYIPLLTDRQTYFYAAGYDRYNHNGAVFLYSKTINTDTVYQEKYGYKVPEETNLVRLQYKFFIVEYIPISKTRARVRLASKIDMKLNFVPQFILNTSARKFAFNYFKNIIKVNKKFEGSNWDKKMKENPDFYMFFKKKIEEYIPD